MSGNTKCSILQDAQKLQNVTKLQNAQKLQSVSELQNVTKCRKMSKMTECFAYSQKFNCNNLLFKMFIFKVQLLL